MCRAWRLIRDREPKPQPEPGGWLHSVVQLLPHHGHGGLRPCHIPFARLRGWRRTAPPGETLARLRGWKARGRSGGPPGRDAHSSHGGRGPLQRLGDLGMCSRLSMTKRSVRARTLSTLHRIWQLQSSALSWRRARTAAAAADPCARARHWHCFSTSPCRLLAHLSSWTRQCNQGREPHAVLPAQRP